MVNGKCVDLRKTMAIYAYVKDVQYIYGRLFALLDARDPAEERSECLFPGEDPINRSIPTCLP